jgi:hypothetical protein
MKHRHISRRDVLNLAEALDLRWDGLDSMPVLFSKCVEQARRVTRERAARGSGETRSACPADRVRVVAS